MHEQDAKLEFKRGPVRYRREWVAVLVISHLCLTFLASMAYFSIRPDPFTDWPRYLRQPVDCAFGLQIGQIALLASWLAFATPYWVLRLHRFLALAAWLLLPFVLGQCVVESESAKLLVEEHSAYMLLQLLFPVVILLCFHAICARQFLHRDSE